MRVLNLILFASLVTGWSATGDDACEILLLLKNSSGELSPRLELRRHRDPDRLLLEVARGDHFTQVMGPPGHLGRVHRAAAEYAAGVLLALRPGQALTLSGRDPGAEYVIENRNDGGRGRYVFDLPRGRGRSARALVISGGDGVGGGPGGLRIEVVDHLHALGFLRELMELVHPPPSERGRVR